MLAIVVITYNIPADVFLLQTEAIKKFCKDKYELFVVDNSSKEEMSVDIRYHATRLGLNYIRTKASSVDSSDSHAWAANFIYKKLQKKYSFFLFLDHDCIPIKEFSVQKILGHGDKSIAGVGQGKQKTYFWPGCVMWCEEDMQNDLIDFSPNNTYGLDTGGELYRVVDLLGKDVCVFFDEAYCENPHFKGKYNNYALLNDGMFLHFINGSNWNKETNNTERINSLINVTRELSGL